MKQKLQKLELTWIDKYVENKLEPRILIEDPVRSYGEKDSRNMVIYGDNLLALKALEQEYAGKIKCIYIDPPYNTGSAFESYDDGIEHSLWLSLMTARLKLLWSLLTKDNGTILISINDDECHYLKVVCDELFGRHSFVTSLIWNYEGNTDNQAKIINYHEYILVYSKTGEIDDPKVVDPNIPQSSKLFKDEIRNTIVKNGPKNPSKTITIPKGFPCSFEGGIIPKDSGYPRYNVDVIVRQYETQNEVKATTGWSSKEILEEFIASKFNPVYDSKKQLTTFEMKPTGAIEAVKKREQKKGHFISVLRGFGTTNQMRLFLEKLGLKFTYPKPVDLIAYLVEAFSSENDIILDSFAGSGTTGHAVLQLNLKGASNRKFILVELESKNANDVIVPRLKAVIEGDENIKLPKHGGGFKFYTLAPTLIQKDIYGNEVINPLYNPNMLAAAMAKQEGFRYSPVEDKYWKQGFSSEKDFIFTTTQFVTVQMIDQLVAELKPGESLLICCKSFAKACANRYENITIKKIPQMLLGRCEFGKDDYSLNIIRPQGSEDESDETEDVIALDRDENSVENRKKPTDDDTQQTLF